MVPEVISLGIIQSRVRHVIAFDFREECWGSLYEIRHPLMIEQDSDDITVGFVEQMNPVHRQKSHILLMNIEILGTAGVMILQVIPIVEDEVAIQHQRRHLNRESNENNWQLSSEREWRWIIINFCFIKYSNLLRIHAWKSHQRWLSSFKKSEFISESFLRWKPSSRFTNRWKLNDRAYTFETDFILATSHT